MSLLKLQIPDLSCIHLTCIQELAKLFESKRMYERDGKEIIVTVSMDGTVHVDAEAFEMLLKEVGFERTE